jgi:hypothetical protein
VHLLEIKLPTYLEGILENRHEYPCILGISIRASFKALSLYPHRKVHLAFNQFYFIYPLFAYTFIPCLNAKLKIMKLKTGN